MSRVCKFTGRKTSSGNTYTHRGKAKYLGGVGIKITGKTKRKFRPNIQTVTALVDGSVQRIKVSAKAIRMGLVIKPLKRKYAYRLLTVENTVAEPEQTDLLVEDLPQPSPSD
jgi:large subunit ribosomal protein L28